MKKLLYNTFSNLSKTNFLSIVCQKRFRFPIKSGRLISCAAGPTSSQGTLRWVQRIRFRSFSFHSAYSPHLIWKPHIFISDWIYRGLWSLQVCKAYQRTMIAFCMQYGRPVLVQLNDDFEIQVRSRYQVRVNEIRQFQKECFQNKTIHKERDMVKITALATYGKMRPVEQTKCRK